MGKPKLPELPFPTEMPSESGHLNMIIYALSGGGKTHLSGTAQDCEETSPCLFVDFEKGTETLRGKAIEIARPETWKEITTIYEYLRHDNTRFKSVILDSATELQKKHSMGMILGELETEAAGYSDLGKAIVPTRSDWQRTGDQVRKVIRAFRDLAYLQEKDRRVHVIITALEKFHDKKNLICPQLPGALGDECGAMVDILVRLSRQTVAEISDTDGSEVFIMKRHLLTDEYTDEGGIRYMAKNRGSGLGKSMWEPTIAKILEAWKGGRK